MKEIFNERLDLFKTYDLTTLENTSLADLPGNRRENKSKDLEEHLDWVRNEFVEGPVLLYYHAFLIVHIRRKIHAQTAMDLFKRLWSEKKAFLLKKLDLRWFGSALDTVLDEDFSESEKNLALAGILLLNTTKLYETERYRYFNIKKPFQNKIQAMDLDYLRKYKIGHGDLILNMTLRLTKQSTNDSWIKDVVLEIFRRFHKEDTVFLRMNESHIYEPTQWKHLL